MQLWNRIGNIGLLGLTLFTPLLLAGIVRAAQAQTGQPAQKPQGASTSLAVSVKTDKKTYKATDPITLTLTVKNGTKQDAVFNFASGQRFDFEIHQGSAQGAKVWQWSHGMMFTMMLSSTTLAPGKSLTYTQTYKPAEGGGSMAPLAPGSYTVIGTLTLRGASRPTTSATFTVR